MANAFSRALSILFPSYLLPNFFMLPQVHLIFPLMIHFLNKVLPLTGSLVFHCLSSLDPIKNLFFFFADQSLFNGT